MILARYSAALAPDGSAHLAVVVTNDGPVAGAEVGRARHVTQAITSPRHHQPHLATTHLI